MKCKVLSIVVPPAMLKVVMARCSPFTVRRSGTFTSSWSPRLLMRTVSDSRCPTRRTGLWNHALSMLRFTEALVGTGMRMCSTVLSLVQVDTSVMLRCRSVMR